MYLCRIEIRRIFEGVYIPMVAGQIQPKLGMGDAYPEEVSTTEMVNYRSSTIELRIHENGIFLVL